VARDVARIVAHPTEHNLPLNHAGLLMRARSAIRAQDQAAPVGVRRGFGRNDIEVLDRSLPYARYFDVEDVTLRHTRFDGATSEPIERAVLRSADAVTVLPYDPVRDAVVIVEQFRPAAFVRGDANPWVLEPVAGRCDADEPVEEVARREMMEEAGLTLLALEPIASYYPSPGCLSEYLFSFVGLVDLTSAKNGLHGLHTEAEDIRTHILSFDAAMALIETGEADNGPLLLSLFWLAKNRTRLREASSVP
jgi:ADP-ribose pyrophosphatase